MRKLLEEQVVDLSHTGEDAVAFIDPDALDLPEWYLNLVLKTKEREIKEAAMEDEAVNEAMANLYHYVGLPDWLHGAFPATLYHENCKSYCGIYLEKCPRGAEKHAVPVGNGYVNPSEGCGGYFFPEKEHPPQGKIIALEYGEE